MARKSPIKRVNLSLSEHIIRLIEFLARKEGVSVTTKTAQLVEQGLEAEEDRVLVEIVEERIQELEQGKATMIPSDVFWKRLEEDMGESLAI